MSSTEDAHISSPGAPVLPPNVSIFSPANSTTTKKLLNGRIFTRLTAGAQVSPTQLASALQSGTFEAFSLVHRNIALIFDGDGNDVGDDQADDKDLEDAHHEHFRAVCLALKEKDISLSLSGCISDVKDALGAGFQFDELSSGTVLVIDLMDGQDDDDDSDDDEDEVEIGDDGSDREDEEAAKEKHGESTLDATETQGFESSGGFGAKKA